MLEYDKLDLMEKRRAIKWLDHAYQTGVGKLSDREHEGLGNYAAGRHGFINHILRNPEVVGEYGYADKEAAEWANGVSSVLARGELPQTTRLFRGLMWDEHGNTPFPDGLEAGASFREDSFMSTSMGLETAVEFATSTSREWVTGNDPQCAVLHMVAPRGMPSINMNAMTSYCDIDEDEIVLAPSSWRIDRVVEKDGVKHALARCTALHMPRHLEIVADRIIKPGGYRRHPLAPTYYAGEAGAPMHGLQEKFGKNPMGSAEPWISDEVLAQKQDWHFIVDGEEIEWGDPKDYLLQDPRTGACWTYEGMCFEQDFGHGDLQQGPHLEPDGPSL